MKRMQGHHYKRILFFLLFSLFGSWMHAQQQALLYYLVRQPVVKTARPPLLILLHGYGSNETDLFSLAEQLPPEFMVVAARGPYTLSENSYAWYHVDFSTGAPVANKTEEEQSRKLLCDFITVLSLKHKFDLTRIYLAGFSQGAIMSYNVGLLSPSMVTGIGVLSGRLPDEVKARVKFTPELKALKIFVTHGTSDATLPVQYAAAAQEWMGKKGLKPEVFILDGPHTITPEMLKAFNDWLERCLAIQQ
jgi:phospholipase/carboxylesterase